MEFAGMENLEHSFSAQCSEKEFSRALQQYFCYICSPVMITLWCMAAGVLLVMFCTGAHLPFTAAVVSGIAFYTLCSFPCYRKQMLAALRPRGFFERVCEYTFYNDKFTSCCGENKGSYEYRSFTGFFIFKGNIFLLQGKNLFACCIAEEYFGEKTQRFIAALEHAGVKEIRFFALKRWWPVWVTSSIVLVLGVFFIWDC